MQRQFIVKMIKNVSDWLSYAGGILMKVADSAGSLVQPNQLAVQLRENPIRQERIQSISSINYFIYGNIILPM